MNETDVKDLQFHINRFQDDVAAWRQSNFPNDNATVGGCVLAEEVGELLHCVAKRHQNIRVDTTTDDLVTDAFGDVLISLAALADQMGFSLGRCVAVTWPKVRERVWKGEGSDG
jgi:NTP pyrophosphatase (non-canonical NTP hydrolase)